MNLTAVIQTLYADAILFEDFMVEDVGNGPELTHWNSDKLGPEPSAEELEAGWKDYVANQKVQDIFVYALDQTQEIIQEVKGNYSDIPPEKIYAFLSALALWVANGTAHNLGGPYDATLDQSFLGLLGNFRVKRQEVQQMRNDPAVSAEDIQNLPAAW